MATKVRRGTKGEVIQARVTTAQKQLLDRYAETQDVTTSEIVRRLIAEYIIAVERKMSRNENSLQDTRQVSYNNMDGGAPIGSR